MKTTILFSVSLLLLLSCGISDSDNNPIISKVAVHEIESVTFTDDTVQFGLRCVTPNPCYDYHSFETEISGSTILTTVFGETDGEPCIDILGEFTTEIELARPAPGEYEYKFQSWSEATTDTTIQIP